MIPPPLSKGESMKKIEFKYALSKKGTKYKARIINKLYDVMWEAPHYSKVKKVTIHHNDPNIAEDLARQVMRDKLKDKWTGFRVLSKEIVGDTQEDEHIQ